MPTSFFVMVIFFGGAGDGGRAINTTLKFSTAAACQEAAAMINTTPLAFRPVARCIEVK